MRGMRLLSRVLSIMLGDLRRLRRVLRELAVELAVALVATAPFLAGVAAALLLNNFWCLPIGFAAWLLYRWLLSAYIRAREEAEE